MKYELTKETKEANGRPLRRVRYLDSGELGGWLESEKNLSQDGDALVCGNAVVSGDAEVFGDARVSGGKWDSSPLQIQGSLFFFTVSSPGSKTVGCTEKTVEEWLASYAEEFDRHNFTAAERLEYAMYFNVAARRYGWEARLPEEGE